MDVTQFSDPPNYFPALDDLVGSGGVEPAATPVLANKLILSVEPCLLHSMSVLPSVDGYAMVFDAIEKPDDGTVTPVYAGRVYADVGRDWAWPEPLKLLVGCVIVFSTTGPVTLTATNAYLTAQAI